MRVFFNSTTGIDKYSVTSRFKSLSVLDKFFLGATEPHFLIPRGNNAANLLN